METVYFGIILFLFLLAIFDMVVGVSNDAVNFLSSAVGAKVAPYRVIMWIAATGILCGALMSNGMMEIARHGIFRPEQFFFQELVCIFLAVMVTDVLVLDVFNTLGLPTSTTVSMVFELLGGTFAPHAGEDGRDRGYALRRLPQYGEGPFGHHGYLPLGGDRLLLRHGRAVACPSGLYVPLPGAAQVDDRPVRGVSHRLRSSTSC